MPKIPFLLLIILIIYSCSEKKQETKIDTVKNLKIESIIDTIEVDKEEVKTKTIDFTVNQIDSLFKKQILTKKLYPNMSRCGGGLSGYYYKDELKLIESKYQGELGYSSKKVYWNRNKILKVIYREYFAEWGKYEKNYPTNKVEYDASKMTYTDTIYEITSLNKYEFKKMAENKVVSIITDSTLTKRLTDCGKLMKTELESIAE